MKVFKRILIALAIIVALPFVVALFFSSKLDVEREIVINKPRDEVFDYIKLLKNHEKFNKWTKLDPNARKTYQGVDGTAGFVAAMDSKHPEVGKFEQEIKKITNGERIDTEIRFQEPFQSTNPAYLITEQIDDHQTRVKSGYRGSMPYPMNLMCSYVRGKIDEGIATSLTELKATLERN